MLFHAIVAELAVEAHDMGVLRGLDWLIEDVSHALGLRPGDLPPSSVPAGRSLPGSEWPQSSRWLTTTPSLDLPSGHGRDAVCPILPFGGHS